MLGRLLCTFVHSYASAAAKAWLWGVVGCGAGERFLAAVPRLLERRSVIQAKKKRVCFRPQRVSREEGLPRSSDPRFLLEP